MKSPPPPTADRSEFSDALRKGLLLGGAVLVLLMPPSGWMRLAGAPSPAVFAPPTVAPSAPRGFKRANFADEQPSPDARHVADWAVDSGDHQRMAFVIVDKKDAKVYVFNPSGELQATTAALLGSARGDDTVPGVGDKPIAQVLPEERTTPAGRFVAEPGRNAEGEDVVWVDYAAAVSMHRVRPRVKNERRLERLASPTTEDNRISYGCINLPIAFYENVLSPIVKRTGAVIYVLPETRPVREVFGSYDVPSAAQLAQR